MSIKINLSSKGNAYFLNETVFVLYGCSLALSESYIWHSASYSEMHFRWLALEKCSSSPSIFEISENFQSFYFLLVVSMWRMTLFTLFFSLFWSQILNLPASLQNKNTRIGPFPWKRSVLQNPDRERTNQSTGIRLRLGLPYNKKPYFRLQIELNFFDMQNISFRNTGFL